MGVSVARVDVTEQPGICNAKLCLFAGEGGGQFN